MHLFCLEPKSVKQIRKITDSYKALPYEVNKFDKYFSAGVLLSIQANYFIVQHAYKPTGIFEVTCHPKDQFIS